MTTSARSSTRMPAGISSLRTSWIALPKTFQVKSQDFCLDTGHMDYSGMDPIETLRRYAGRTDYIHFKDIDAAKYADVMKRRIRFFEACTEGVMCPIGRGRIDYLGLRDLLNEIGYAGYITIEQERDPRNADGVLGDLRASRDFLRRSGF